jgi:hypothetical protein
MKRKVAVAMGGYIGEVLPSPTQEEEAGNGKYMRVRVRVDITKASLPWQKDWSW